VPGVERLKVLRNTGKIRLTVPLYKGGNKLWEDFLATRHQIQYTMLFAGEITGRIFFLITAIILNTLIYGSNIKPK
jgi:hypothetical protein